MTETSSVSQGQSTLDQLAQLARSLSDSLGAAARSEAPGAERDSEGALIAAEAKTARLAKRLLVARRQREDCFAPRLFSDPCWDMMLDMFVCHAEGRNVCVTDACIAANVPATTALRWLTILVRNGVVIRRRDPDDARRAYVDLSDVANQVVAQWIGELFAGTPAALLGGDTPHERSATCTERLAASPRTVPVPGIAVALQPGEPA